MKSVIGGLVGAQRSIRLHMIVGLAVVAVLTCGIGGWASTQEISGALIAPGQIVVETNVKTVLIAPGNQCGARRRADRGVSVGLQKAHSA